MENSEQKTAEVIVTPTENAKEVSPGVFETTGEVHVQTLVNIQAKQ